MRHPPGDFAFQRFGRPIGTLAMKIRADHVLGKLPKRIADRQSLRGGFATQDRGHAIVENFIGERAFHGDFPGGRSSLLDLF